MGPGRSRKKSQVLVYRNVVLCKPLRFTYGGKAWMQKDNMFDLDSSLWIHKVKLLFSHKIICNEVLCYLRSQKR